MNRRQFLQRLGIIAAVSVLVPTEQQLRRFWQLDQTMVRRQPGWRLADNITAEDFAIWLQQQQRRQADVPFSVIDGQLHYLNWQHVVFSADDGSLWTSNDGGLTWDCRKNPNPLYEVKFANGIISDVKLWNYALSEEELAREVLMMAT